MGMLYAIMYSYMDFERDVPLTPEYIARTEKISRLMLMYGGRRLADLMMQIFQKKSLFLQ